MFTFLADINLVGNYIQLTQSSTYSPSNPAVNGIDGDLTTYVETNHGYNGQWWNVKFSKSYSLGRFIVHARHHCCTERIGNNEIYIFSGDRDTNRNFCAIIPYTGQAWYELQCSAPITGDGVELYISSGQINFGEIKIYEI